MSTGNDIPTVNEALVTAIEYAHAAQTSILGGDSESPDSRDLAQTQAQIGNLWANIAGLISMTGMAEHLETDHELAKAEMEERRRVMDFVANAAVNQDIHAMKLQMPDE